MPPEITAPNGETPNGADPTTEMVTTTTQVAGETPETTTNSSTDKELADLKAALKKANSEAAAHRIKARELDELKARMEAEKLSETEKLQKQLADIQRAHEDYRLETQNRLINAEVHSIASRLGFADPADAIVYLQSDRASLELDEHNVPTNAEDLLKDLLKAKPYLAGKQAASSSGGATNPSRSQTSAPQEVSSDYIAKLTPEIYAALSPEQKRKISQYMADHPVRYGQSSSHR